MLQVLLSGLASGAIYGLVGMGFAIAFYVTRVINFAQGQLLMVGVMVAAAIARTGAGWVLTVAGGIGAAALMGAVTYLVAVRPVLAFDRSSFAWLVSTLGVALILQNLAAIIWGPTSRPFPALLNDRAVHIGGATLTLQEVAAIVVALFLAASFELVRRKTLFAVSSRTPRRSPPAIAATGRAVPPIIRATKPPDDRRHGAARRGDGGRAPPRSPRGDREERASDWFPFVVVLVILLLAPQGLFAEAGRLRELGRFRRRPGEAAS